ncbi:MAG: purine-nucleoside phosphorylase [Clostridia bacterium]|nr:purine-nucleoside phosphorylase [Clostridia bacterium]
MATPHIAAEQGAFAKTVLMPGDPLRAKYIAEHYLENPVLVNNVRGVQGYTGAYRGVPVSVMASGMGIPSIGIYSYELFHFFGVENILRVGSAGGLSTELKLRDIVLGMGACTNSNFASQYRLGGAFAPIASFDLLESAVRHGREMGLAPQVGNLLSSDPFYNAFSDANQGWMDMGVLAVEMEAAGLYMTAARAGKRALAICTISDHIVTGEALDADARQNTFTQMMELALEVAVEMDGK